jgi:hypothetical protein
MSYSISTLLTRHLHDGFGENDPSASARGYRRDLYRWCVFFELRRASIVAGTRLIASPARSGATPPDFPYQPIDEPDELGNGGRIQWFRVGLVRHLLTPL